MLDIKQLPDGDIDLDYALVEPTAQHQRDLLVLAPGQCREFPLSGIDSINYLHDNDPSAYLRTVRQQLAKDGMRVAKVEIDSMFNLTINAEYETSRS